MDILKTAPSKWAKTSFGEVANYINGRCFKSSEWENSGAPIIRIQNLNKPEASYNYTKQTFDDKFKVSKNDLLFSWSASLDVYVWKGPQAWLNQHIFKIEHKGCIIKKFLFYALKRYLNEIKAQTHGAGMVHITKSKFEATTFNLPPFNEQKRIVAKIEELFSELDKGVESLKYAQEQLKIYRQSILKHAFEENDKTKILSLADVTQKIQIGPFGSQLHKTDYISGGIPLINPMHIQDGKICPNSSYTISKAKRDVLPNYILEVGDLIMGRRGEMGRCGLVSQKEDGWFCGTGSLFLRPITEKINPIFLYYYMQSPSIKESLVKKAAGTTMANLNKKIIKSLTLNLPNITKQQKIVEEIEEKFSVIDQLEQDISDNLKRADVLRQAILKKAFSGNLVDQDPNDEPASVLLERIAQEKQQAVKAGRKVKGAA